MPRTKFEPENTSFYKLEVEAALKSLNSKKSGLSKEEATQRLKNYGFNELRLKRPRLLILDLIEPFKSAFVLILILAAGISLLLRKQLDAVVILTIVAVNALIFYVQRFTADRTLKALTRQDQRRVKVLRDGKLIRTPVRNLVPGDIVLLAEGVKVPADGRLIEADDLTVDESAITGESLPIEKVSSSLKGEKPIYERLNSVFQGTFVRSGLGKYVITATGNGTEMAKIAALSRQETELSPLQKKIDKLTGHIVLLAIAAASLAFFLGLYRGIAVAEMLRFALSMTVSAVPESLPIALTIVLVLGIKRMAKKKALVRNLTAVETLGQTTLIATDKTGTLTKNELTVSHRWHPTADTETLERHAWLSLTVEHDHPDDPLEQALYENLRFKVPAKWKRVKILPFNQLVRLSGAVWETPKNLICALKGAPEAILDRADIAREQKADIEKHIRHLSSQGYRLIGFGSAPCGKSQKDFPAKLKFEGIVAFSDQLRPEIPKAIEDTRAAGIEVVMLTGDHIETARTFGKQAGLISATSESIEGHHLEKITLSQLRQLLRKVKVFARVLPEHKYKLLESVHGHHITAMTGDGVNDVPAITKADVGLAMGGGTDAAKEAADVILLDNNYATILEAVREGRTTLANVRKMVFYLFSTNLGEVLTMIGALIIGLPLPLTALQVLWINLVTDGFTVVPLGLEPTEESHMQQPPDDIKAELLSRPMLWRVILTASTMAVLTLVIFWLFLPQGIVAGQTMAFATLVVVQWANALNARSHHSSFVEGFARPNYKLFAAIGFSALLQWAVFWGPLQPILGVTSISSAGLWALIIAVAVVLLVGDVMKRLWRDRR